MPGTYWVKQAQRTTPVGRDVTLAAGVAFNYIAKASVNGHNKIGQMATKSRPFNAGVKLLVKSPVEKFGQEQASTGWSGQANLAMQPGRLQRNTEPWQVLSCCILAAATRYDSTGAFVCRSNHVYYNSMPLWRAHIKAFFLASQTIITDHPAILRKLMHVLQKC